MRPWAKGHARCFEFAARPAGPPGGGIDAMPAMCVLTIDRPLLVRRVPSELGAACSSLMRVACWACTTYCS